MRSLKKIGITSVPKEPFTKLFTIGMVTHATYQEQEGGAMVFPTAVKKQGEALINTENNRQLIKGAPVKMSKSKRNVIPPEEIVKQYGADACRLFIISDSPPERDFEWTKSGIEGSKRFLARVARWGEKFATQNLAQKTKAVSAPQKEQEQEIENNLKIAALEVEDAITKFHMNVAVAKIRIVFNQLEAAGKDKALSPNFEASAGAWFLKLLHPFAPHITEEIWSAGGFAGSNKMLCQQAWPEVRAEEINNAKSITWVVQINGKLRGNFKASPEESQENIKAKAMQLDNVQKALQIKPSTKTIVVPGRLVNFVCK